MERFGKFILALIVGIVFWFGFTGVVNLGLRFLGIPTSDNGIGLLVGWVGMVIGYQVMKLIYQPEPSKPWKALGIIGWLITAYVFIGSSIAFVQWFQSGTSYLGQP